MSSESVATIDDATVDIRRLATCKRQSNDQCRRAGAALEFHRENTTDPDDARDAQAGAQPTEDDLDEELQPRAARVLSHMHRDRRDGVRAYARACGGHAERAETASAHLAGVDAQGVYLELARREGRNVRDAWVPYRTCTGPETCTGRPSTGTAGRTTDSASATSSPTVT